MKYISLFLLGLAATAAYGQGTAVEQEDMGIEGLLASLPAQCSDQCRNLATSLKDCATSISLKSDTNKASLESTGSSLDNQNVMNQYTSDLSKCFCNPKFKETINPCETCLVSAGVPVTFNEVELNTACDSKEISKILGASIKLFPTPDNAIFANSSGKFSGFSDFGKIADSSAYAQQSIKSLVLGMAMGVAGLALL